MADVQYINKLLARHAAGVLIGNSACFPPTTVAEVKEWLICTHRLDTVLGTAHGPLSAILSTIPRVFPIDMSVGKTDFASHPLGMGRVLAVLLERLFDQQTAQTAANALFLYAEYDRTRYNKVQEICALAMDCIVQKGTRIIYDSSGKKELSVKVKQAVGMAGHWRRLVPDGPSLKTMWSAKVIMTQADLDIAVSALTAHLKQEKLVGDPVGSSVEDTEECVIVKVEEMDIAFDA